MIDTLLYKFKHSELLKLLVLVVLGIVITPLSILFFAGDLLAKYKGIKKTYVYAAHLIVGIICIIILVATDYNVGVLFYRLWYYVKEYNSLSPFRLLLATIISFIVYQFGYYYIRTDKDRMIDLAKAEEQKMLPEGKFDYSDERHMLLFGATQYGKGVCLNHIMKHFLMSNDSSPLCFVTAKQQSTDPHSQLEYARKLAEITDRNLFIISADPTLEGTSRYAPLRHMGLSEILNLFKSLDYDSTFYQNNTLLWIQDICRLLQKGGKSISFQNILLLYKYESDDPKEMTYLRYAKILQSKGIITDDPDDEDYDDFFSSRIKDHALTAKNDHATLEQFVSGNELIFGGPKDREAIDILTAFQNGDIIFFDLNGASMESSVRMIGACIFQEINSCIAKFSAKEMRKMIIFDEASYYLNPHLMKAFYNASASAGYTFITATQGPSDINACDPQGNLWNQLSNNAGQTCSFNLRSEKDPEAIANVIGTYTSAEDTRRFDDDPFSTSKVGSLRLTEKYLVHPNTLRNLPKLHMVYSQKGKKPVIVKWSVNDL